MQTIFNREDYAMMLSEMSDTRAQTPLQEFIDLFEKKGVEFFFVHELRVIIYHCREHKGMPSIPISGNKDDLLARVRKTVYVLPGQTPYSLSRSFGTARRGRKSPMSQQMDMVKKVNPTEYEKHLAALMTQFCSSLGTSEERGSA
jgi:vacuolar-type H+-ATPase subunit C/Vma6